VSYALARISTPPRTWTSEISPTLGASGSVYGPSPPGRSGLT